MKKSTTHFSVMSEAAYRGAMTRYSNLGKLAEIRQDFDNFAYNSLIRYADTGDVVHIVRVLVAAKEIGRFRLFRGIFKKLVAHAWHAGTNSLPDRKSKANKKKLAALRINGAARFLIEYQDAETRKPKKVEATKADAPAADAPKNTTTEWTLEHAIDTLIDDAAAHNVGLDEIVSSMVNLQKLLAEKKTEISNAA